MQNNHPSLGFLRVAVVTPELRVADVKYNTNIICTMLEQLAASSCQLALFPELCITGYSCADLFYQSLLLNHAHLALETIKEATNRNRIATVVGLPLELVGKLYNCAVFISQGEILGIVPKTYLPSTNEFYEERWFTSGMHCLRKTVEINGIDVPIGTDLLFIAKNIPHFTASIEICEDLWTVNPRSGNAALAGATLHLNLSASNELLGKVDYRRALVKQQSARCLAAYLYACSGPGESTTDVVYSGHSMIAENGIILAETNRFQFLTQTTMADIDLQHLNHERLKNSSFSSADSNQPYRIIRFELPLNTLLSLENELLRPLSNKPFVLFDTIQRSMHCREVFSIQSMGLAKRLRHTGMTKVSLGISGGLDSTLALLVTVNAFKILNLNLKGIVTITMPGFGTTLRTQKNAEKLSTLLGVNLRQIPINNAVRQHFYDIDHDESVHDVIYENAQARERTQILMDVANQIDGLIVGTGDLSELALGWCTYNADHMSMFHVNAGVPKTLVHYLIEWYAESEVEGEVEEVLLDICATPITPELLPLAKDGALQQKTEETIGPFILHDFFLFYTVRHLFSPRKVFFSSIQSLHWVIFPSRNFALDESVLQALHFSAI